MRKPGYINPPNPYAVLYHTPSLPAVKFAKMALEWHREKELKNLDIISAALGGSLIPAKSMNWYQKKKAQARVTIGHKAYYVVLNKN